MFGIIIAMHCKLKCQFKMTLYHNYIVQLYSLLTQQLIKIITSRETINNYPETMHIKLVN